MELEPILPCRHCGSQAGLEAFELNSFTRWKVRCPRCNSTGIHYHRPAVAIGLWNEAHAPDLAPAPAASSSAPAVIISAPPAAGADL